MRNCNNNQLLKKEEEKSTKERKQWKLIQVDIIRPQNDNAADGDGIKANIRFRLQVMPVCRSPSFSTNTFVVYRTRFGKIETYRKGLKYTNNSN